MGFTSEDEGPKKKFYFDDHVFTAEPKKDKFEEIADKRERSIQSHVENKEVSIVVTSSIRDAVLWCTSHPDWGADMTDEKRAKWIDEIAKEFIKFHAEKKKEYEDLYYKLMKF